MKFTEDQVASINGYQRCGRWHPFTCGADHEGERVLIATAAGMRCPTCDYQQDWAHKFMADWSWLEHGWNREEVSAPVHHRDARLHRLRVL
jgi:hypothetical protein